MSRIVFVLFILVPLGVMAQNVVFNPGFDMTLWDTGWATWNRSSYMIYAQHYYEDSEEPQDIKTSGNKADTKVIALEWVGGAVGATLASFLYKPEIEKGVWAELGPPPPIFFYWWAANSLGSTLGVNIVGRCIRERGSFIHSLLGGIFSSLIGISISRENIILAGITAGVGATAGYNVLERREK